MNPPELRPTVSVIVRSMDRPELARALASIAAQDAAVTAEVVVVAACGARHAPVPAKAGRFDVRFVPSPERLPRPRAANAGLDAARGTFITWLDDDDELLPGQFARLLAVLDDPAIDFAHAKSLCVDKDGNPLHLYGGPWIEHRMLTHGFFQLGATMFRRTLLDRGVRFDERLDILEDLEFFVQCAQVARFGYLAEPVMRFHIDEGTSGATMDVAREDSERVARALTAIGEKWKDLAQRLADSTPARLERAVELLNAGRSRAAIEAIDPVLARSPDDVNALNLAGMARLRSGDARAAEPYLRRAQSLLPQHPGIAMNVRLLEEKLRAG